MIFSFNYSHKYVIRIVNFEFENDLLKSKESQKGGSMLVLSRKRDEKILLQVGEGEDIELTVVRIDQNKVRLGIKAGDNVTILRSELIEKSTNQS